MIYTLMLSSTMYGTKYNTKDYFTFNDVKITWDYMLIIKYRTA